MKYKDYLVSNEDFEILNHSKYSGILATTPIPPNLNSYYQSDDYLSHSESKKSLFEKVYHRVKTLNLKYKYRIVKKYSTEKEGKILDYGCGIGDFLDKMKTNNWQIAGIEPSEKAVEIAQKKLDVLIQNPDDISKINPDEYDVVSLWHVLEHVKNLEEIKNHLNRIVKKNGLLIIAVPNHLSFDAKFYKNYWGAWDVPRHLWHFNRLGIKNLFHDTQLKLIKTKPLLFDSFYVSLISANNKGRVIDKVLAPFIGLFSNIKALFTTEYSSVIYIFRKD